MKVKSLSCLVPKYIELLNPRLSKKIGLYIERALNNKHKSEVIGQFKVSHYALSQQMTKIISLALHLIPIVLGK